MKMLIQLFIFCFVFFLYLHIIFHLKTNNQSEIYEIQYSTKPFLEEACQLRLPVIIHFASILQITNTTKLDNLPQKEEINVNKNPIPLEIFVKDETMKFSENNLSLIQETYLIHEFKKNDIYFRPPLMSLRQYDILIGKKDVITPFRYELNYRNYFLVTQGSIQIKLAPPDSKRHLTVIKDYEHFQFSSQENPWTGFDQQNKIKITDVTLKEGQMIYIPSYWWYSIKMMETSSITVLKYKPIMNVIANIPHYFQYFLQQQNIQKRFYKKEVS
jgi:hypothetical protein